MVREQNKKYDSDEKRDYFAHFLGYFRNLSLDLCIKISLQCISSQMGNIILDKVHAVFSPSKIQGMVRGNGVGGACSHKKAFGPSPFPTSKRILY